MEKKYSFGKKALFDAIQNDLEIELVYLLNEKSFNIELLRFKKIKYIFESKSFFSKFNLNNRNLDVIFQIKNKNLPISLNELLNKVSGLNSCLILMLDEIQDVGNLGAILRTADAFAVDAIIYKKNNQTNPYNNVVIKTSTNAIQYLTMCEVSNLNYALEKLKNNGFWSYASSLSSNSVNYNDVNYDKKTILIVGNENHGISPQLQKNSDHIVHIKQYGHVQSLNVSVATGILLSNYRLNYTK